MNTKYLGMTRPFIQTFISCGASTILNVNCQNQLSKRWAGHSKWQNIKSTKEAADHNKSMMFQKLSQLMQLEVRRNGPDVSLNSKLKSLVEEAKKINMPKATIERALKVTEKMDKPYWTVFSGPKGVIVGFEVVFPNNKNSFLLSKMGSDTKKIKLKLEPHFSHLCNERGIIVTDPLESTNNAYEKALEDAIETGIEEVHENDDKSLIFECSADRLDASAQKLLKLGYNILSTSTELEFQNFVNLDEEEVKSIERVITNLQNKHEEVLRASYNVAKQ